MKASEAAKQILAYLTANDFELGEPAPKPSPSVARAMTAPDYTKYAEAGMWPDGTPTDLGPTWLKPGADELKRRKEAFEQVKSNGEFSGWDKDMLYFDILVGRYKIPCPLGFSEPDDSGLTLADYVQKTLDVNFGEASGGK